MQRRRVVTVHCVPDATRVIAYFYTVMANRHGGSGTCGWVKSTTSGSRFEHEPPDVVESWYRIPDSM
jgi:hypothetical protein